MEHIALDAELVALGARKAKKSNFFVITVVCSALLAHSIWLAMIWESENPTPSAGASGLTYAFGGAVLSTAVQNATDSYSKLKTEDKKRAKLFLSINGLAASMLLVLVVGGAEGFLNKSPGSNYLGYQYGIFNRGQHAVQLFID